MLALLYCGVVVCWFLFGFSDVDEVVHQSLMREAKLICDNMELVWQKVIKKVHVKTEANNKEAIWLYAELLLSLFCILDV